MEDGWKGGCIVTVKRLGQVTMVGAAIVIVARYTGRPLHGVRILDNCTRPPLEWSYTLITTITDVFDNNLAYPPVLLKHSAPIPKSFKRFREGFETTDRWKE